MYLLYAVYFMLDLQRHLQWSFHTICQSEVQPMYVLAIYYRREVVPALSSARKIVFNFHHY